MIDSDEDDGRVLESSDEDSEDEDHRIGHVKSGSEGSSTGGGLSSNKPGGGPGFAAGEDSELARESGFVIRGGKIARRRSSMALDRHEL